MLESNSWMFRCGTNFLQALLVQEHAGYKRLFLSREVFMHTSPRIPPIDPFFSAMMSDMEFLYAQELHQMLDLNP